MGTSALLEAENPGWFLEKSHRQSKGKPAELLAVL